MAQRTPLRVGAVLSSGDWGRRLHAHAADHSDVEVVVVRDAHAVVESGLQLVCTDDTVLWFTRAMMSEAEARGITVVGVRRASSLEDSDARLVALGIVHRVSDSVPPAAMLEMLSRLRPRDAFQEIVSQWEAPEAESRGAQIVVGGPPGAGGREVAVGVAANLAVRAPTVLVDCNESSPGVARRLGLGLQPHVLDAVDEVTGGGDLRRAVARPVEALGMAATPFDVIAGLPAASEWQRLPPAAADVLVAACRTMWRYTVVVTSPVVEDLRRWVDRYGLSRHLLATAPTVIGVCEATPRGVLRFVDWLGECQPSATVMTVVNKVPSSRFSSAEVVEQLGSLCGDLIAVVASAQFDRRVTAAEWDATLPARGPFTKALGSVTDRLLAEFGTASLAGAS
jgi:hypothetical protein